MSVLIPNCRCPDCVRAEPAVRRAFVAEQQRLLVCDVGTREAWKASTPAHTLRNAPWALTCIPSIVALDGWAAGQPARAKSNRAVQPRLDSELESCTDPTTCQVFYLFLCSNALCLHLLCNRLIFAAVVHGEFSEMRFYSWCTSRSL